MLDRAYIEITNVCNLSCDFCSKTSREKRFIDLSEFALYARKIRSVTDCVYLHVMGEPLLHPCLSEILDICEAFELRTVITTNGTLLHEKGEMLLTHGCLYKIQISLHSFESNKSMSDRYFDNCFDFARKASKSGVITVFRLWNKDGRVPGQNSMNSEIVKKMKESLPGFWQENKRGFCISSKLYLEFDEHFIWPSSDGAVLSECGSCHALTKQIAVLCDGTVVPCCLDSNGNMPLGNLNKDEIEDILFSSRACAMIKAFRDKKEFVMPFCKTCGYADRFRR